MHSGKLDNTNSKFKKQEGDDMFSARVSENRSKLEELFADCCDLKVLPWRFGNNLQYEAFSAYFETLSQYRNHNYMRDTLQSLVEHHVGMHTDIEPRDVRLFFDQHGPDENQGVLVRDMQDAAARLLEGYVLVCMEGWDHVIAYDAKDLKGRAVEEPVSEAVVKGPREGTVENVHTNIGLLRTRLQTPNFKIKKVQTGGETKTPVFYGYLEGAVPQKTMDIFVQRIARAADMEILESSYIEELIEDSSYSPFPQHRYTERTDTAVAALLAGKIIVLVQGTGVILLCPGLFTEFFQSNEDYYERTLIANMIRLLRIVAFFIALTLPSVYIALSTFHPELIPTVLLLAMLNTREGIPFPSLVEVIIMLFFFELLREAGIRLPRPVGSAVSIVGALIIGEAAINAGIASPIMVVIVAVTGIASFAIPQYAIAISLRLLQLPLMLLTAALGIFGVLIGLLWIMIHLTSLHSLGQPYLSPLAPLRFGRLSDTILRAPLRYLSRASRSTHKRKNFE